MMRLEAQASAPRHTLQHASRGKERAAPYNSTTRHSVGQFDRPGVRANHPDLVAYWRFDEGQGYLVQDATGHGHDLYATQEPRWAVVRWLSVCGDGVMQGSEECDDGDTQDGDGCSSTCTVSIPMASVLLASRSGPNVSVP